MEPTRTASFDDEMYSEISQEFKDAMVANSMKIIGQAISKEYAEAEEQQIADSHDITKSSFGIEDW